MPVPGSRDLGQARSREQNFALEKCCAVGPGAGIGRKSSRHRALPLDVDHPMRAPP